MKKIMVIIASLTMAVMISGAALAAGPGDKGKAFKRGPELTKEQVEQMKAAHAKFMLETMDLRIKKAAKSIELRTLYAQPKHDPAKIKALALELVDLRSAIEKKRIEVFSGLPAGVGYGRRGFGRSGARGGPGGGFGPGHGKGPGGFEPPCWR